MRHCGEKLRFGLEFSWDVTNLLRPKYTVGVSGGVVGSG